MAVATTSYTTGPAVTLRTDLEFLSYNGCIFSPLFHTEVSGVCVKDRADRTVKYMEYTIKVDGYVTLPDGAVDIDPTMRVLRELLTVQGGALRYEGRGMDLTINPDGAGGVRDVAWGPVPELLEFQPMGAGRSAKIVWNVKVRIPEVQLGALGSGLALPMLQFNYEVRVDYGEDGYCTISTYGTLEVPLTRTPSITTRTLTKTVDDLRKQVETRVMAGIDLARFRMRSRNFSTSRDKRTMEWNFIAEEKPYMDLPPNCTIARGNFSVRPAKAGMGLCTWLCTLRATYTIRKDWPRRHAWVMFAALLRKRMLWSNSDETPMSVLSPPTRSSKTLAAYKSGFTTTFPAFTALARSIIHSDDRLATEALRKRTVKGILMDFQIDEGLYLDSKTVTFSATWRLNVLFQHILTASGLWRKMPETFEGKNHWATSMKDIMGAQSWPPEIRVDPKLDIIVDFGA